MADAVIEGRQGEQLSEAPAETAEVVEESEAVATEEAAAEQFVKKGTLLGS